MPNIGCKVAQDTYGIEKCVYLRWHCTYTCLLVRAYEDTALKFVVENYNGKCPLCCRFLCDCGGSMQYDVSGQQLATTSGFSWCGW